MANHLAICRVDAGAPQTWTEARYANVEGVHEWSVDTTRGSNFESIVVPLAERFVKGMELSGFEDISIAPLALEDLKVSPPPVAQDLDVLLRWAPTISSLYVYAPILVEEKRSCTEMWSMASRHRHGLSGEPHLTCSGMTK